MVYDFLNETRGNEHAFCIIYNIIKTNDYETYTT